MGKVVAIVNQKGGVGKTTTVMNIAGALSAINYRVLVVDFDPQGNASSGLGFEIAERNKTIYDVLMGKYPAESCIYKTKIPQLDIMLATMDLAAAEVEMVNMEGREFALKNSMKNIADKYDYILVDCPPSLSLLTINALTYCQAMIIPLQCEFFALEGLTHLLETSQRIQDNFNPSLKIGGILLTMYDKRNKLTDQVENDVRGCLGAMVYDSVIPRNIRLAESSSYGVPAILYDPDCAGSIAYMKFVEEMVKKDKEV